MRILVDTREQPTAEAKRRLAAFGVPYERVALRSGDYSAAFVLPDGKLYDMRDICVVERKMSIDELCGNFSRDRKRFVREFERIMAAGCRVYLLVENASWEAVLGHRYRSGMTPRSLMASITAWMARYDAHVIFCRAETTPHLIREILYREAKERLAEL